MNIFLSVCSCVHKNCAFLGPSPGYWDTGTPGYWDIGTPRQWDTETMFVHLVCLPCSYISFVPLFVHFICPPLVTGALGQHTRPPVHWDTGTHNSIKWSCAWQLHAHVLVRASWACSWIFHEHRCSWEPHEHAHEGFMSTRFGNTHTSSVIFRILNPRIRGHMAGIYQEVHPY